VASDGALDSPWGALLGQMTDAGGAPIMNDHLWGGWVH